MNGLLISCILIPMITAVASYVYPGTIKVRGAISIAGSLLLLVLSSILLYQVANDGPMSNQMGGWQAPMGITLIADMLSAMLIVVTAIVALTVNIYAIGDVSEERVAGGFFTFMNMLIAGVVGAFLTGDLFNLYVWFEVMLISTFALLVLGGNKVQLDGAVKYVAINLISTVLLLTAIGLLYGLTGTLNMADLSLRVPMAENQGLVSVVAVLFLIAFGIKAAVFPLYFWLPASYHTLPISVTAVFAALMTKVGIYALMRTFTLIFPGEHPAIDTTLLCLGLVTMILGVFGAMTHSDIRRILAFHVIGSIGFMLLGLGLGSAIAMGAAIFYMVHGILIKALLFMIAGIVGTLGGSFELSRLGGLYQERPGFSIVFLLAALALIGIPPLSGFWAKLLIIEAGLHHDAALVIAFVVVASLLTFIPLIRIWSEAFWKARPLDTESDANATAKPLNDPGAYAWTPVLGLSAIMLLIGFLPGKIIDMSDTAAQSLMTRAAYLDTVLPLRANVNGAQTQ
ncbi:MAG: proton-conducting transporter membrane subunit [Granulosicoccus sp.]